MEIPPSFLENENIKFKINGPLLEKYSPGVSKLILENKIRAQVGGKKGGILGAFSEKSIYQEELNKFWLKDLSYLSSGELLDVIESGRYYFKWKN